MSDTASLKSTGIPHVPLRVALSAIGGVFVGGAIGYLLDPLSFLFISIWACGVGGGVVGFAAGFLSHISDPARREKTQTKPLLFMAGVLLFMSCVAGLIIHKTLSEMEYVEKLSTLTGKDIQAVEIRTEYDGDLILRVEDPEDLAAFAAACRDMRISRGRRYPDLASWYVEATLVDGRLQMNADIPEEDPTFMLCYHFSQSGSVQTSLARTGSPLLLEWFVERMPVELLPPQVLPQEVVGDVVAPPEEGAPGATDAPGDIAATTPPTAPPVE